MEQIGFFLVVCLLASVFVQLVRQVPQRRLLRRSLWLTANAFALQRQGVLDGWGGLSFVGVIDKYPVALFDGSAIDASDAGVHIEIEAPALRPFTIDLVGGEWGANDWQRAGICLWPRHLQRELQCLVHQDASFSLRDGVFSIVDPHCGQSTEYTIDLIDRAVLLVASLSSLFSSRDAILKALYVAISRTEERQVVRCGVSFLMGYGVGNEEAASRVLACFMEAPEPDPDERYILYSCALAGRLLDSSQKAQLVEAALVDESARIQMLGAEYAGHAGYIKLHQMAADEAQPADIRIGALRHLMAMYPQREAALRGLLRRALVSHSRRLQQVAIEAMIAQECQERSRRYPDTFEFLERLSHILGSASSQEIQSLARESQPLLEQALASQAAEWLSLPSLVALLEQRTRSTLLPMARLLQRWGLPNAEPVLLGWLTHPSDEVRLAAMRGLGACGTVAALQPLRRCHRRFWQSSQCKGQALRAISRIEARLHLQQVGHLSLCGPMPSRGSLSPIQTDGGLSIPHHALIVEHPSTQEES